MAQFHHTRWTARDGAPLGVRKLSQTTDGWLWLGGTFGLYRFDGVRFERFSTAADPEVGARPVDTLAAGADGELWVGWLEGGAARIDASGALWQPALPQGQRAGPTRALAVQPGGDVWAVMDGELLRLEGLAWRRLDDTWALPPWLRVASLHIDGQGALWVIGEGRWFRRDAGSRRFLEQRIDAPTPRSGRIVDGQSWMVTEDRLLPLPSSTGASEASGASSAASAPPVPSPTASRQVRQRDSSAIVIDRSLNLWSVYCPAGLCRTRLAPLSPGRPVPLPPMQEHFTRGDGLSSDIGMTLLEDRDGHLWVATQTGLDRFRDTALTRFSPTSGATNFVLQPDGGDGLWVGALDATAGATLWHLRADGRFSSLPWPRDNGRLRALQRDGDGVLWIASTRGVWRLNGRTLQRAGDAPAEDCGQLRADPRGLWALCRDSGLRLWRDGDWRPAPFAGLTDERPVAFALDRDGAVWAGHADHRLLRADARGTRAYGPADGLTVGPIRFLSAGRRVVVVGTRGLQLRRGDRFATPVSADPEALRGVTGAVETAGGDLWLNGARGAVLIRAADLRRFDQDERHALPVRVFDTSDGYPAGAMPHGPQGSLAPGAQGRLWFAGLDGIACMTVEPPPSSRPTPPVRWLAVVADQHAAPARPEQVLPAGTQAVALRFTALELGTPERLRFQARLDGADQPWQDLGAQRELSYRRLPPGHHRVELRALGDDGAAPGQIAALAFRLPPTLTQTWWFRAASLSTVLLLAGLALRWRLGARARRDRDLLRARLDERERIAGQINDTLLQGLQGLTLHFQKVANRLDPLDPRRALMDHALDRADELMLRGREQLDALRDSPVDAPVDASVGSPVRPSRRMPPVSPPPATSAGPAGRRDD